MSLTNQQTELGDRHLGGVGPGMANYLVQCAVDDGFM